MTSTTISDQPSDQQAPSLVRQLRASTHDIHERLDRAIMAAAAFDTLEGYVRFARMQYLFHREIEALYGAAELQALLPGLRDRCRLPLLALDLIDLGQAIPVLAGPPRFQAEGIDPPTALGWLYVAEGSNMGAALLRKEAAKLGLSDTHGARHLAPAPEGPAAFWRAFTAALDAAEMTREEQTRAGIGAREAFVCVEALAHACFD